jgi:FkbM family methyltransferase
MSEAAAGKLVGGFWLPASEVHLEDMMIRNPKGKRVVDGKATYQLKKLERAMEFLPKERRAAAVDIGAHCGLWSVHLVKLFEEVHAFEPVPLHRQLYAKNVDLDRVHLYPCALGDKADTVDIQVPLETTGNAHLAVAGRHPGTHGVKHPDRHYVVHAIPLRTLDSFELRRVDFIKIDVEGVERAVVEGAKQTILESRPVIVIEQKGNESAYGDVKDAAAQMLLSWGLKRLDVLSGDWIMQ